MNRNLQRITRAVSLTLTPVVLLATVFVARGPAPQATASSHREAPLIAFDPQADTTDVYAFVAPDANNALTLVANYIPLEAPYGGPNYYRFADDVLYKINLDNVGDAQAHISYEFRFKTTVRNQGTFLYNTNVITPGTQANPYPALNVIQVYTVTEVVSTTAGQTTTVLGSDLLTPPVNVGGKSTPNYDALVAPAIHTLSNGADQIKVFAGQRDDPFFVDLSSVFDLLSLRPQQPPIGYPEGPRAGVDGVGRANVHSLVLQVPISRILASAPSGETVVGVWSTSSRQTTQVIGALNTRTGIGNFVQVSRLGMPLVNEAVIPLALKDAFNSIPPSVDAPLFLKQLSGLEAAGDILQSSVLTPELQTLLKALYNVPNPGKPRNDIFQIFLQGIKTATPFTITTAGGAVGLPAGTSVNQPKTVTPAEMLRINLAPIFRPGATGNVCKPTPDYALGVLGGDACGFPNGRRLADDVTDIELLAVAGAAYGVTTGDSSFSMDPALIGVLDDGVSANDKPFLTSFPYVASPWGGKETADEELVIQQLPLVGFFFGNSARPLRAQ